MRVHNGADLGIAAIHLEVQRRFRGRFVFAGDNIAVEIEHHQIVRRHRLIADARRRDHDMTAVKIAR